MDTLGFFFTHLLLEWLFETPRSYLIRVVYKARGVAHNPSFFEELFEDVDIMVKK
jgi:hypothetical protein